MAADRRAISYWPDSPELAGSDTGPVLVVVRYKVPEAHRAAFVPALPALRRSRLRTGATSWQIHRNTTGTEFVEHLFVVDNGPGYQVDLPALHAAHPEISWTRFDVWATHAFGATT